MNLSLAAGAALPASGAPLTTGAANRYLPEPSPAGSEIFSDFLNVARGTLQRVLESASSSAFGGAVGGVPLTAGGELAELIALQIATQQEMQVTTLVSNIERSKHESKMSAIRNIRVG